MRTIERLSRLHAEAAARGVSVDQIRDEQRAGWTRRDFLKSAGAGAAVVARAGWPAFARAQPAAAGPRAAIVGAGIAALSAATALVQRGARVTLYEASSVVGGRMHSDTANWLGGQTSE